MTDFTINLSAGQNKRLLTGGKYCPDDILVTAAPPTMSGDMSDPEYVYAVTRPKDWLPMPRPTDNECFCLGQILPGHKGYFVANISFSGECTVEFGTVVDNIFVVHEFYTPTSGTQFIKTLEYADYSDQLSDGTRQYMARIYGRSITSIDFTLNGYEVSAPHIVDIACGLTLNTLKAGSYNTLKASLFNLQYLNFVGNGMVRNINADTFIGNCPSVRSVGCESKCTSTWAAYSCYYANSLEAISPNMFAGVTNGMPHTFDSSNITGLALGHIHPIDASYMFQNSMLTAYTSNTIDLSNSTNLSGIFRSCPRLTYAIGVNISSATSVTNMFGLCYNLSRLTFAGETTPGGWTLSLNDTRLDHYALVEMIDSLPTATAAAAISITGTPGASELTDQEIAVATAKNWTVTL